MTPACPWPSASRGISICRVGPATRMRSCEQAPADDARVAYGDARVPGRLWGRRRCGGDRRRRGAVRCTGIDDFSAMLAATAKMIAAGEQGRVDDLALTVAFARTLGVTSPSTGIAPVRSCRGAQLRSAITRIDPTRQMRSESVHEDDLPPDVYRWVAMMAGSVNLCRGRVDLAVRQLRDALSAHRLCVPRGLAVPLLRRPCDRVGRAR